MTPAASYRGMISRSSRDRLIDTGPVVGGVDHAADQRDVERLGELEIAAEMIRATPRVPSSSATPRSSACARSSAELIMVVGLDQRVVADLEQLGAPARRLVIISVEADSGCSAVSCHCQKKA